MSDEERKGLRFEVYQVIELPEHISKRWQWTLVGAEGPVCRSVDLFLTEKLARSNIAASKGRMKASKFAKTITIS